MSSQAVKASLHYTALSGSFSSKLTSATPAASKAVIKEILCVKNPPMDLSLSQLSVLITVFSPVCGPSRGPRSFLPRPQF
jgi:hypothetical protein